MFSIPNYSTKQKELQIINGTVMLHDCHCTCNNPAFHSLYILTKQLSKELSPADKQQLIKCLGEDHGDTAHGDTEDIALEDLEKLFEEEDTTKEEAG